MFMHQPADAASLTGIDERARPAPAGPRLSAPDTPAPPADAEAAAKAAAPEPARRQRARAQAPRMPTRPRQKAPKAAAGGVEPALVAETGKVIANLQRQGVLKPPAALPPGGGPGHRTKNCRPVQINLSETMFRQLKMIAATQSISIKDQIIAALVQQGYKT